MNQDGNFNTIGSGQDKGSLNASSSNGQTGSSVNLEGGSKDGQNNSNRDIKQNNTSASILQPGRRVCLQNERGTKRSKTAAPDREEPTARIANVQLNRRRVSNRTKSHVPPRVGNEK